MATTVSVKNVTRLQNAWLVTGSIALSGSYATHGDTLNFVNAGLPVTTDLTPRHVELVETPATGTSASGYTFNYAVGTDLTNGALQAFLAGVELAAGAYPSGLLSAAVKFLAIFPAR